MRRILVLALVLCPFVFPAAAQNSAGDSETLKALLSEVRQLRKDLQATSVAAQRVQIVLYRLEGERSVVAQLTQSLQSARLELASVQKNRQEAARVLKQAEEERDGNPSSGDRAAIESY